ncbi:class I SAM-dependent methyltransferase [Streptomyces sp. YGL11-2]|uniref:class I SAM-dependent methyltransferase n=1 Tax=Streptomyces sp. YGL11-2 TaxID=3414028 RepID=UPI003CF0483E
MTTNRALSFDTAAAQYAANRPSYPPALLDALEETTGRSLNGARIADIGAGTGIATALLYDRGAQVIAVEPGPGMAAELHRALPDIPLVRGDGNRLPLATASLDLITYAQSWHWTDPAKALPEARRALRPGGALALWWNGADHAVGWIAEQDTRLRTFFGANDSAHGAADHSPQTPQGLDVAQRTLHWSRRVPLTTHLANLASHSAFLVRGMASADAFLTDERARLSALFPDGTIEESYVVRLTVAVL